MTLEEAQKVVDRLRFVRFEAEDVDMPHPDHVTLDGIFTAPELEAILVVLRSKATPDGAPTSRILTVDDEGKLRVYSEKHLCCCNDVANDEACQCCRDTCYCTSEYCRTATKATEPWFKHGQR